VGVDRQSLAGIREGLAGGFSMSAYRRFTLILKIALVSAIALALEAGKRWLP
jgi:hypothetical protein